VSWPALMRAALSLSPGASIKKRHTRVNDAFGACKA